MNVEDRAGIQNRRPFLGESACGIGTIALSQLLADEGRTAEGSKRINPHRPKLPHDHPKAKNVIFLHMAGAPSQLDLFEDKPKLREYHGKTPPESLMEGKRFAFLKGNETLLGSQRKFERYGEGGLSLRDL